MYVKAYCKNSTTANRPLWIKPLSTSLRQMKFFILQMWHGKRNCGILSIRISKIQRTEEEDDKRHWKEKTKYREITRSTTNDKVYDRVYKKHKAARIIESGRG